MFPTARGLNLKESFNDGDVEKSLNESGLAIFQLGSFGGFLLWFKVPYLAIEWAQVDCMWQAESDLP